MTDVCYAPENYRDIETVNSYRERWEQLSDYLDSQIPRSKLTGYQSCSAAELNVPFGHIGI